jgi:PAS domain S-box-containing protein/putative nucleotidyltransferase with HDIG domain
VALSDDAGSQGRIDEGNVTRRERAGLERYRGVFDSLLEGVAYCRMLYDAVGAPMDFIYLDVNPAFDRLTGLHNVRGRLVTEVIPGIWETNPELFAYYDDVVKTGEPVRFDVEIAVLGKWLHVEATRPSIGHFLAVFEDITERRIIDEELRESEERLRRTVVDAPVPMMIHAEGGEVIQVNRAWEELSGYRLADLPTTQDWTGALYDAEDAAIAHAIIDGAYDLTGRADQGVFVIRTAGGGTRVWDCSSAPLGTIPDGRRLVITTAQDVTERTRIEESLRESNERLERLIHEVVESMGLIVETRDPYTEGHEVRVAHIGRQIAEEMGLPADEVAAVEIAGLLHDIGKLCVPAEILTKPGELSASEFRLIQEHSRRGHEILKGISFPWPVSDVVLQHHERMDGSGYPDGLAGDRILLAARILAVADTVEAMSSHRPYRPAFGLDVAIAELSLHPGVYDPDVSRACLDLYESGRLEI